MSNSIDVAHVQMFSDSVVLVLDQEGTLLKDTVMNQTVDAKFDHFDRLGTGNVRRRLSRNQMVELDNIEHSRRRVIHETFTWNNAVDKADIHRILQDARGKYVMRAGFDLGLQIDRIIVDALNGAATSVDANDSGSSVVLPASQIVDEDFTIVNSNLTVAKLRQARQLIIRHSGSLGAAQELHIVCNASAVNSLLGETEVTSHDFNTVRALVDGTINSFMGFKFKIVKDGVLPGVADGSDADPVRCMVYARDGLGLSMSSRGMDINVDRIPLLHGSFLINAEMDLGAVRIEEEKVVAIECVQAIV